jgi:plastocyanin
MKDSRFAAACIQADAGATLSVVNSDGIPHTYTVEDTEVNVVLEGNETAQASLAGIAPGTYAVVCTYHPGMKAALQVR